jgi:hypothetical protein
LYADASVLFRAGDKEKESDGENAGITISGMVRRTGMMPSTAWPFTRMPQFRLAVVNFFPWAVGRAGGHQWY